MTQDYEISFTTEHGTQNKKTLKTIAWTAAVVLVAVFAIQRLMHANDKKQIKDIKHKIEQIQTKKETAIADSLRKREICLTDIEWNHAWNADYDIENHIVQCSNLRHCPLGKLYSKEEIERMKAELRERLIKRVNEMHPVSGLAMAISCSPYIDEETTVKDLVRILKGLDPAQNGRYYGGDGRTYELFYPVRFPDTNPNIIIDKEGNWCLTDPNLIPKFLDKGQKASLMNSALTLYIANEEMEVVNDIRNHFEEYAQRDIKPLLEQLAKLDPTTALKIQRNMLQK